MMPSSHARRPKLRRRVLALMLLGTLVGSASGLGLPAVSDAASAPEFVSDDRVTVRLVSEHTSIEPGRPVEAGLSFELADDWHVYWRNPGDSGEPPRVHWYLPPGFEAGPLHWPTPERLVVGPIVNFAYAHEVLLPLTITTPADLDVGHKAQLAADVSWLVCREEECIPGQAKLALELPVMASEPAPDPRCSPAFANARADMPSERPAFFSATANGATLNIPDLQPSDGNTQVTFFPFDSGIVKSFSGGASYAGPNQLQLALDRGDLVTGEIDKVEGVVVIADEQGRDSASFVVRATTSAPSAAAATSASGSAPRSLALILAFAFAGGLLLNLMPCVFPVLSLKVLGFVEQAHHDPRRVRLHGWAFAGGVIASFWVLAVTLLALRAGGEQLGWGFQLQSPLFLALLCALLFVLALTLSGVAEIGLWMTTLGGSANQAKGYWGSVATGALATVVATPCTAPFMGPALGFALTQPALVSLLVFTSLGAGMAIPYVALAHFPSALSWLPKPGAWMETVRQFTAFPLYATVLWLLYVFSHQTSADAAWRLMIGLLFLAVAMWGWGVLQRRPKRGWLSLAPVGATAAVGLALGLSAAQSAPVIVADDAGAETASSEFWRNWSPERVAALRAEGRPVFVNFTADWCLSCQVNERTVFATETVRELFRTYEVEALKADWTNEDERIARTLADFGRDGVPLYVFYPAEPGAAPQILPQLPTAGALREAFSAGSQRVDGSSASTIQTRRNRS